jgi:hypothetical protein
MLHKISSKEEAYICKIISREIKAKNKLMIISLKLIIHKLIKLFKTYKINLLIMI